MDKNKLKQELDKYHEELKRRGIKLPGLKINHYDKIKFARKMKKINKNRKKLQQKEIEYNRRKLSTAPKIIVL